MKDIYNKILKEALDIMDFDSWDDTEQSFKDIIQNNLLVFQYKVDSKYPVNSTKGPGEYIQIFELTYTTSHDWEDFYKFYKNVYIDGKHVELQVTGCTVAEDFKDGIYNITIKGIENGVDDAIYMFFESDIYKCPAFQLNESISTGNMFYNCKKLVSVGKFDLKNVRETSQMFSGCLALNTVPLMDLTDVYHCEGMFNSCRNLSEETKKIWKDTVIEKKIYMPGIKETIRNII